MISRWIKLVLAFFHLSDSAVCEMSEGKGVVDYHDYSDDIFGYPGHFELLECKRCHKKFII